MPSSRSYDRNPNSNQNHHHHRGGGFSGRHHLPFDSPPPNYPPPMGFRPTSGFRPAPESGAFIGGGGVGGYPMPHAGQKRRGISPSDGADGSSFAKLFVGSVPKTATEEDVRPLFEEHGDVIEVALLKDKRTGQQQGPFEGLNGAHMSSQLGLCRLVANLPFMSVL